MTETYTVLLNVAHAGLSRAFAEAGMFGEQIPGRYGMHIMDAAHQRIRLYLPWTTADHVLSGTCWAALHPHLEAMLKAGYSVTTHAIIVDVTMPVSAASLIDFSRAWVVTPDAGSAAPANHTASPAVALPDAGLDLRDFTPLDTTLDVAALIYGGTPPRGLAVVGFRRDQFGAVLLLVGGGQQTVVANQEICSKILLPMLDAAHQAQPESVGIAVDVASRAVYAVGLAALLSAVARQVPIAAPITVLEHVVPFAHPTIEHVAGVARSYAVSANPFMRAVAAMLCLLSAAGTVFCGWLLYRMGVEPVYKTIIAIPGLDLLDDVSRAVVLSVFGSVFTVTVARVLAWVPSLFEAIGVLFSASPAFQRVLFWTGIIDMGAGSWYYASKMVPSGAALDKLMQQYHIVVVGGIIVGNLIGGVVIGAVSAVAWELMGACLAVMTIALWPAVPWLIGVLIGGTFRGLGRMVINLWYGGRGIGRDLKAEAQARRGHGAVQVVYYDPNER